MIYLLFVATALQRQFFQITEDAYAQSHQGTQFVVAGLQIYVSEVEAEGLKTTCLSDHKLDDVERSGIAEAARQWCVAERLLPRARRAPAGSRA